MAIPVRLGPALCLAALPLAAGATSPDPAARVAWADRLTWGAPAATPAPPGPGPGGWLDAQIADTDDALPPVAAAQVARMRITTEPMVRIVAEQDARNREISAIADPDAKKAAREAYQKAMNALADEARARSVLRELYAPDQLREQMTWFWVNQFSIHAGKRDVRAMVGDYEETIHARALGRFRDLLEATLRHPAMLRYLDNDQNSAGHVNENYARELLELHSMGVGSGYSQQDVQELARILTGVGVSLKPDAPRLRPALAPLYRRDGLFEFNPARHDFGDKRFLGHTIKGSGWQEVEQALDLIAAAPATAHHVCDRLATFFMGDAPPPALVARMADTFRRGGGDIGQVIRTMARDRAFAASLHGGFKDPVHYAVSAVRLAYGDRVILNPMPVVGWINRMGEGLYARETPDGYPLGGAAWSAPGQMATRFDVARQIGGGSAGLFRPPDAQAEVTAVPSLQGALQADGRIAALTAPTRTALAQSRSPREWNALFLSSPDFMRR